MAFQKGVSGNPKGRPKRTDTEAAQRERIKKALPGVLDALIAAAQGGDTSAAKLLLERALPALRPIDRAAPLPLPDGPADLGAASAAALAALVQGALTPDQAAGIAAVLGTLARVSETTELERRLHDLETVIEHKNPTRQ